MALLAVAALAASPPATVSQDPAYRVVKVKYYGVKKHHHRTRRACRRHWDHRCRKHVVRRRVKVPAPPAPVPAPTPTPTPTPPPLPSRTTVDLDEWRVTPAYRELAAGEVEFNAANLGEDDHDLSIRQDAAPLKTVALAPGESASVRVTLAAGAYTLYCSLPGHEGNGMRATLTVR
ncbi:MAG TPA: plastocyanin/azurin family copper-binding protein [Solirubrobacteraceae bacterium]|nr:plastocyanin/azurin family copper-binding protein [Solirubrobacteraceae bacterium]